MDLRIKISKPNGSLKYEIMKRSDVLEETNIATALNLNTVVAFYVGNKLKAIFESVSKEYNLPENKMNVRIYTKQDDCEPSLYLFDEATAKAQLDLNKFIN